MVFFKPKKEGDFTDVAKIEAGEGYKQHVIAAYVRFARRNNLRDARGLVRATLSVLKLLDKQGLVDTKANTGGLVVGKRFTRFENMSPQQLFAKWATVQQAFGRMVVEAVYTDIDLLEVTNAKGVIFQADDLDISFELIGALTNTHHPVDLHRYGLSADFEYTELVTRLVKLLRKQLLEGGV